MDFAAYDLIVVGSGFFGATIAERCARVLNKRVLVMDKRHHIGGNSYSETNSETGIEVHKYGTHIFHTPNTDVWNYLAAFTAFTSYQHRVFVNAKSQVYSMPINLGTMCQFFGRQLSPSEARALIAEQAAEYDEGETDNLERKAISLIGRPLYEAFIRGYTRKQWQVDPAELAASIITRLPVRYDFNNRYFSDPYEGLPVDGYTAVFKKMLSCPLIDVRLGMDYFDVAAMIPNTTVVVFTGPIDRFFNYRAGMLSWRTIDLTFEVVPVADYQGTAVVNYADEQVPFTRIHEFRHLHPERDYQTRTSMIAQEYSRFAGHEDEPCYPVGKAEDRRAYAEYQKMAAEVPNVVFGGRLGSYKYLDMHQAIGAALKTFDIQAAGWFRDSAGSRNANATT